MVTTCQTIHRWFGLMFDAITATAHLSSVSGEKNMACEKIFNTSVIDLY
jgi:hypothetical protein